MGDYQPIHRDPNKTHYYTPYEEVPAAEKTFPMYISGNLRISNPGTARAIAEAAKVVRFVRMEDVWVTGYIAKYLHIQHQVMSLLYLNILVFHKFNLILIIQKCAVEWCGFTQKAMELYIQKAMQNPRVAFKDYLISPQPSEAELGILGISNLSSLHMTLHQWSK